MYIISKEVVMPCGRINQTLRSQDELEIGFLPVLVLRLRPLADAGEGMSEGGKRWRKGDFKCPEARA